MSAKFCETTGNGNYSKIVKASKTHLIGWHPQSHFLMSFLRKFQLSRCWIYVWLCHGTLCKGTRYYWEISQNYPKLQETETTRNYVKIVKVKKTHLIGWHPQLHFSMSFLRKFLWSRCWIHVRLCHGTVPDRNDCSWVVILVGVDLGVWSGWGLRVLGFVGVVFHPPLYPPLCKHKRKITNSAKI